MSDGVGLGLSHNQNKNQANLFLIFSGGCFHELDLVCKCPSNSLLCCPASAPSASKKENSIESLASYWNVE